MKAHRFPLAVSLFCLTLILGKADSPAQAPPEVREFRSQSGSRLKAMIIGMDPSGKALLQPYTAKAVPLNSLSEEDQAYINAWKERKAKEQSWIEEGEMASFYADPGVSLLRGNLRKLQDGNWQPYETANPVGLHYVAYYFSKEHLDDQFILEMSETYEKLRKRSDLFEIVYITLGTSDQAVKDYVKEKEFAFPVLDPSSIGVVNESVVGGLFKGSYPQMVVIDRKAAVQVDSFRGKDETPQLMDTLEQLEKLVIKATRDQKRQTNSASNP